MLLPRPRPGRSTASCSADLSADRPAHTQTDNQRDKVRVGTVGRGADVFCAPTKVVANLAASGKSCMSSMGGGYPFEPTQSVLLRRHVCVDKIR